MASVAWAFPTTFAMHFLFHPCLQHNPSYTTTICNCVEYIWFVAFVVWQRSWDTPADPGWLCFKATVLRDAIKEIFCVRLRFKLWSYLNGDFSASTLMCDIWCDMIWYMIWYMIDIRYDVIWYMIWYMMWYMIWCDMIYGIWYDIWYDAIWYILYMIRYCIWCDIWYDVICYDMIYHIIYDIRCDIWYDVIWCDIWYDIWCDIWYDMIRYDTIYDMMWYTIRYDIWYAMIWYILLTAIGLSPGGNSTVHIYTQTAHRTTQWNAIHQTEHT